MDVASLQVRRLWKEFSQASDAVVFVIDVSDPSRFAESKTELNSILQDEQVIKHNVNCTCPFTSINIMI